MPDASELDVTETERQALHECQLAMECVYRAYGELLGFHHHLGRGMDRFNDAEELLRASGHEEFADDLRDRYLPDGIVDGKWSYEVVGAFRRDFLRDITEFEGDVREELADGLDHVSEREQQREWRERAEEWEPADEQPQQK